MYYVDIMLRFHKQNGVYNSRVKHIPQLLLLLLLLLFNSASRIASPHGVAPSHFWRCVHMQMGQLVL